MKIPVDSMIYCVSNLVCDLVGPLHSSGWLELRIPRIKTSTAAMSHVIPIQVVSHDKRVYR